MFLLTPINHLFSAIYRVRGRPGIFTLRHFGAKFGTKQCWTDWSDVTFLAFHIMSPGQSWMAGCKKLCPGDITRRRDTGYDAWSNNKCTAFIWVKENSRPKSNQDEFLLANGTIKGKYSIAVDLGVSCGHFDHATDSPEQEHLDALEVNVTPVAIPPPSTAKSFGKKHVQTHKALHTKTVNGSDWPRC